MVFGGSRPEETRQQHIKTFRRAMRQTPCIKRQAPKKFLKRFAFGRGRGHAQR